MDEHTAAVLFRCLRAQAFLHVEMQSSWDYPRHFYATRMSRDWPTLQFICAINEDMGSFGGLVARMDGEFIKLTAAGRVLGGVAGFVPEHTFHG